MSYALLLAALLLVAAWRARRARVRCVSGCNICKHVTLLYLCYTCTRRRIKQRSGAKSALLYR